MPEQPAITIRVATADDIPALMSLKGSETLHRDRLRDADACDLDYFIVEDVAGAPIALGLCVYVWPDHWPQSPLCDCEPTAIDLWVREDLRGQGIGTRLVAHMEGLVRARGFDVFYMGVDPVENPRALALYERLGYKRMQDEPYWDTYSWVDSDGVTQSGGDWAMDLVKVL